MNYVEIISGPGLTAAIATQLADLFAACPCRVKDKKEGAK